MPEYLKADGPETYTAAALLFREYAAWLGIDLSFQNFEEEMANLESMYAAPYGGIILCTCDEKFVGCVAVRQEEKLIAEMKRMYVQPGYQHRGIGQALLDAALDLARQSGYHTVRLDTLRHMTPALNLYKKNGFVEIDPYYFNPVANTVFLEKKLDQ